MCFLFMFAFISEFDAKISNIQNSYFININS